MQHIALAGISSGITAWYTQNKGFIVVLGLLGYLILKGGRVGTPVKRRWAKCCLLSLLALTIFFLGNFYFIQAAGFRRWWWCLVTFPVKYYGSVQLNNWHIYGEGLWPLRLGSVAPAFVYATVPLVYIICLLILHTSKQDGTEGRRSAVFRQHSRLCDISRHQFGALLETHIHGESPCHCPTAVDPRPSRAIC